MLEKSYQRSNVNYLLIDLKELNCVSTINLEKSMSHGY